MIMLVVRVAVRCRSGHRDTFLMQLRREEQQVPTTFEGCERFTFGTHPDDPDRVLLYEEWRDREAFEAYRESEFFEEAGAKLFPLMDGPPDSSYFEAERVGP
jgi:quinol monooxygenase YgiN